MPVRRFLLCLPAALLALFIAAPASAQEGPAFVDTVGTFHEVAVERLVAEGLVQGCTEDRFCSTDDLTRGQMASILSRALGLGDEDGVEDGSDDATLAAADDEVDPSFVDTEDSVHAEAIELLAEEGLVKGCEQGRFCPNDSLTRGQLATMLVAAFDLEPASGEETYFIDGSEAHGANIEALGANAISNGCGPVTFCTHDTVQRAHAALFLTRTLGLTEAVTFAPFEERLAEHEELERQRREQERLAEQERIERERIEAERRREHEEREQLEAPGRAAVEVAMAQLGKPYQWAAAGPHRFDCSGLVYYAWQQANGVTLPRSSRYMHSAVTPISRSELIPGDLVFYHSPVSHVAMYIGDGRVVEAPGSGRTVRIRDDGLTRSGVVGFGRPGVRS
ncbi:MAG: NlpC/P60 family protein [Nitriliruptoraceae bacterium]